MADEMRQTRIAVNPLLVRIDLDGVQDPGMIRAKLYAQRETRSIRATGEAPRRAKRPTLSTDPVAEIKYGSDDVSTNRFPSWSASHRRLRSSIDEDRLASPSERTPPANGEEQSRESYSAIKPDGQPKTHPRSRRSSAWAWVADDVPTRPTTPWLAQTDDRRRRPGSRGRDRSRGVTG